MDFCEDALKRDGPVLLGAGCFAGLDRPEMGVLAYPEFVTSHVGAAERS